VGEKCRGIGISLATKAHINTHLLKSLAQGSESVLDDLPKVPPYPTNHTDQARNIAFPNRQPAQPGGSNNTGSLSATPGDATYPILPEFPMIPSSRTPNNLEWTRNYAAEARLRNSERNIVRLNSNDGHVRSDGSVWNSKKQVYMTETTDILEWITDRQPLDELDPFTRPGYAMAPFNDPDFAATGLASAEYLAKASGVADNKGADWGEELSNLLQAQLPSRYAEPPGTADNKSEDQVNQSSSQSQTRRPSNYTELLEQFRAEPKSWVANKYQNPFTLLEDQILQAGEQLGISNRQISDDIDRTRAAVAARIRALRVASDHTPKQSAARTYWRKEQAEIVERMFLAGDSDEVISAEVGRSVIAVKKKRLKLGLTLNARVREEVASSGTENEDAEDDDDDDDDDDDKYKKKTRSRRMAR
jgi:hypothetical protein